MRVAALVALLPALATLGSAHPTAQSGRDVATDNITSRKSLSFGPHHRHATFEVDPAHPSSHHSFKRDADPKRVASSFIASKIGAAEGEGFYIREDVSTAFLPPCHQVPRSRARSTRHLPRSTRGRCSLCVSHRDANGSVHTHARLSRTRPVIRPPLRVTHYSPAI